MGLMNLQAGKYMIISMILKYIPSRPIRSLLERGEGGGWENGIGA
jgi:hypothetical protein